MSSRTTSTRRDASVGETLAGRLDGSSFVERAIFGTIDPGTIAAAVEGFCEEHLRASIEESVFFEQGQASVFGVRLAGGREVAVRAHDPSWRPERLAAIVRAQTRVAEAGFPCPRPVLDRPEPLGNGYATVEELILDGEYRDAHQPEVRRQVARHLAWLLELTETFPPDAALPRAMQWRAKHDPLWPRPHSLLFDFDATAEGAEWIDDLASRAKAVIAASDAPGIVGHTDWSVKHFRFDGDDVRIVYDWDSLAMKPEPNLVGHAAATFTATWELPVSVAPTFEEMDAFVEEYEEARGRPFTPAEHRLVDAAAVYGLAYSSRCEHALDPTGGTRAGSVREALSVNGPVLLAR